jgi:hypothetical protein
MSGTSIFAARLRRGKVKGDAAIPAPASITLRRNKLVLSRI